MLKGLFVASFLLSVSLSYAGKGAFEATDKNFQSAVLGSGKNVFVKFLAPW